MNNRIVSGVQSSGILHIGNYLGSVKNWLELQNNHECFFFIADLHAMTVKHKPKEIYDSILKIAAIYLASGIDPKKSVVFQQSAVPQHAELAWILSCNSQMGWLNRMTQFKDKSGKNKEKSSVGLFTYPVLMAADILLYAPKFVPVGEDQTQHLELTRDIALAFNRNFNIDFFQLPEIKILKTSKRIMNLRDASKKMSKSDEADASRINLFDEDDSISKKIRKAKTDSDPEISFDVNNRPEVSNLISIYAAFAEMNIDEVVQHFSGVQTGKFKSDLAELLVEKVGSIRDEAKKLLKDETHLKSILHHNTEKAQKIADANLKKIKSILGINLF